MHQGRQVFHSIDFLYENPYIDQFAAFGAPRDGNFNLLKNEVYVMFIYHPVKQGFCNNMEAILFEFNAAPNFYMLPVGVGY